MRRLILLLVFVANPAYAGEEIEIGLTWKIKSGIISKPVFEFEFSELEFSMSTRQGYSLDIGGSVELANGTWKINTIRKSDNYSLSEYQKFEKERQLKLDNTQWLRGRMARRFPHKEIVAASNAAVATNKKFHDDRIIRKLAKRWSYIK
jgi:hypothetical protein